MKKPVAIVFVSLAIVFAAGFLVQSERYHEVSGKYASSKEAEETVRTQFNSALESIAEIQDSLLALAPEESGLHELQQQSELNADATQTQKERMLNKVAVLKESIRETGERIHDLETKLEGSRTELASLNRVIDNLKRSVAQKEAMIADLNVRIGELNVTVATQGEEIRTQGEEIQAKRREIGTIGYVIGTKKTLKEQGIIVDKGGFLGLGKSTQLSGVVPPASVIPMDTDVQAVISIPDPEPRILSAQAPTSYALERSGPDVTTLRILNPVEFRKVKYLVIMVDERVDLAAHEDRRS